MCKQNSKAIGLTEKAKTLCIELENNPRLAYSRQLLGNLKGMRSIRINIKHRLIYELLEQEKIVKILSPWGYYMNIFL